MTLICCRWPCIDALDSVAMAFMFNLSLFIDMLSVVEVRAIGKQGVYISNCQKLQ